MRYTRYFENYYSNKTYNHHDYVVKIGTVLKMWRRSCKIFSANIFHEDYKSI